MYCNSKEMFKQNDVNDSQQHRRMYVINDISSEHKPVSSLSKV